MSKQDILNITDIKRSIQTLKEYIESIQLNTTSIPSMTSETEEAKIIILQKSIEMIYLLNALDKTLPWAKKVAFWDIDLMQVKRVEQR